mmetsp:Transcript_17365/g.34656  ORF Transcript_17365/g.34656 Transcript_17365/m.34656 type:complete len:249 (-) Transcript_17365:569-1315(-)|eukprot:CAMPEP_0181301352 /NCGR_PEP_ID=MMETSP1101-20121128/7376_1 /TAXON_ID=46948 /ORGANISM="Rhodomonas abbreviata, Strain Caron Lab Isolate" /LENGTH=248 /DNA_ID=CAMNT_0023406647 /DNA_START=232 /DNA_END=978 /DNA_ORIENTATION=-
MPPSRPVSSKRTPEDNPEAILVHKHLVPKNIVEAKTFARAALHEVIGYVVITSILLALGVTSLVIWISSYVVPYGTFVVAECLVLNSTQTMLPEGFLRQPLYRAEVYVYVFNTTNPECCCQDMYGRNRCAEWEALAYDNILETHTAGSKVDFLRQYGYPGTFHKCWHSPGKDKVLMKRSSNSPFLIVPVLALTFGLYGLFVVAKKAKVYRASHYYVNKYSGAGKDENEMEEAPLRPKRVTKEEDEEED